AAAVLANDGIRPKCNLQDSGKRILKANNVKTVIALMSSCGMYDGSGQFAHDVGIPGKSGVGGGIMCVVPGKLGIATYAPPLDEQGNSVRGLYMLKKLSEDYSWSLFSNKNSPLPLTKYGTSLALDKLTQHVRSHVVPLPNECKKEDYIPELRAQNAHNVGIALYRVIDDKIEKPLIGGSSGVKFTMQSISTLFALMYTLMYHDEQLVFECVGKEPSGEPFNVLKWKDLKANVQPQIPFNPMINAGAILISTMVPESFQIKKRYSISTKELLEVDETVKEDKDSEPTTKLLEIDHFLTFVRQMCGNDDIQVNAQVYESERNTGYKNRSLAWEMNDRHVFDKLMRQHGLTVDASIIEDILSVYFRLCSIEVDCIDLARAGTIIANQGYDPDRKEFLITPRIATITTSMMSGTGLFDGSGEFANAVGIPAKSGVSGGILACVPGRCGIGAFSPVVDQKGNSYRASKMLEILAKEEHLSIFES
ncbi:MAG: hypothetical protein HN757_18560, partial [Calditrichaeota bacterium]|nr:hypothetical protein [Calditrichota bacterium]